MIVNGALRAWNAGDVAALKALFADNAAVCFPDWGEECTTGTGAIGAWIEELVALNFSIEPESLESQGNTVTVVAKVWADPTRALGVAPLITTDVYTVEDGKITGQTSTLSEDSSTKLMTAEQNASVAMAYIEAINSGDIDAALDLLHENVYVELTPTLLPGFPVLYGRQDVLRAWLEEMVTVNLKVEVETLAVQRSTVTIESRTWSDYLDSLNAAPISVKEVYKIRDGQISSLNRVIPGASLNKIQEGLVALGIPETITPQPGEVLASEINDIAGFWIGTIAGVGQGPVTFDANGDYEMNGDSGTFWFNSPFLWIRTSRVHVPGDPLHSCLDTESIGSYVVYVTRYGDQPVELRFVPILDPCMLRSTFLMGENLTPR
jgi:ketosteroid isomerase-like protein